MLKVCVPVFEIVTVWAGLTFPTVTFPKPRLVGVIVTAVAAVTPVPETLIVCGLPAALSVSVNVPDSACVDDGVKVILMVQVPPLAATVPTQLSVSANHRCNRWCPLRKVIELIVRSAVPSLVT